MTRFYLVRHGQTEWNRVERFRGRVEIPLNDQGLAQARAVGARLAGEDIAAVLSSPLGRAWETALAVAEPHGLEVRATEELNDMDFGHWQGLTPEEVAQQYPELYQKWLTNPDAVRLPGGEALEDVRARVVRLFEDLVVRFAGKSVVLVSHKVVCKVLICELMGLDTSHFWQIEQDNGALSIYESLVPQGNVVTVINDTCHLREMELPG